MVAERTAAAALDRDFLQTRCKIIEIAANLDRIERGDGAADIQADPRLTQIREAVGALLDTAPGRAERCQMIFSLRYEDKWSPPNAAESA